MNLLDKIFTSLKIIRTPGIGPVMFAYLYNKHNGDFASLKREVSLGLHYAADELIENEIRQTHIAGGNFLFARDFIPEVMNYDVNPVWIYKGNPDLLKKPIVSVVGSRNNSLVGEKFCRELVPKLGNLGYVIASGMACGIDTFAHESSLHTGTIGVLSGGIDNIYPSKNALLYESIAKHGLLITSQPIGTEIKPYHFPQRNKIIALIAESLFIIESTNKSGALNTALHAQRYNKTIYTIPGHPYSTHYEGNNTLIKNQVAIMLRSIEDFMPQVQVLGSGNNIPIQKNDLINKITHIPIHIDDICSLYKNSSVRDVMIALGELVMEDKIHISGDMAVSLK